MNNDYYKNKSTVVEYIKQAKDVDSRHLIDKLKRFLPQDSNVLELGSGPGTDWKILSETYSVIGSDYSAEFINHLRTNNPKGEFVELDATILKTERSFDGIYANKVLHLFTDDELKQSLERQHERLNRNGVICHSFWKGKGTEIFNGLFVNYQTEETLRNFYAPYFDFLLLESYKEFEEGDSLVLIGRKK